VDGILNEYTNTIHRHQTGAPALHAACGVTHDLAVDQLRVISIERASTDYDADRCGRCFDDGGGY
jgi:hypothetical protein